MASHAGHPHELDTISLQRRADAVVAAHDQPRGPAPGADPRGILALRQAQTLQAKLADAGLAGITYPCAFGGQGLTEADDRAVRASTSAWAAALEPLRISLGNCAPVIRDFGSPSQQRRWLPALLSGRAVACQMFSEPEAGSDVAAVRLKAERDGDRFILQGQKVWTTLGHIADVGVVLARTDDGSTAHSGLSMFLVDLTSPGIEVRPIHQIDGASDFDEVFFDDVVVPESDLLGEQGRGWDVAVAMLGHQRLARGTGTIGGVTHPLTDRLAAIEASAEQARPWHRPEITRLYTAEVAQSLMALRARAEAERSGTAGPAGSLTKLSAANTEAAYGQLVYSTLGPSAQAWSDPADARWSSGAITTRSRSIAGGTSEIQRNIIGERVLGLPREPRPEPR